LFDRARARWPELFYFGHNALFRAAYRDDWQRVDQLIASIRAPQPHDPSIEVHAAKANRMRNWTSIDAMRQSVNCANSSHERERSFCDWQWKPVTSPN
jgi:hypothetical protein